MVFENAAGDIELWSKAATAQVEQQLRERRQAFQRRREALAAHPGAPPATSSSASARSRPRTSICAEGQQRAGGRLTIGHAVDRAGLVAPADRHVAGRRRVTMLPAARRSRAELAARVVAWQRRHGRHGLPWQGTRDPYRVWLSEVMLQQTQVATVLDYYPRFLARFPDVQALAAAPLDDGAGAVERPGLLQPRAQPAPLRAGGGGRAWRAFPGSSAALATLPGIGRSTAAAIAAFCFGERAAILDGNVKRVLTRALGFDADLAAGAPREGAVGARRGAAAGAATSRPTPRA